MVTVVHTERVARSRERTFDAVVRHQRENHPRWEDEVLEVRSLDEIEGVGHRTVMVRREHGRTRELVHRCTEYDDGHLAAYLHEGDGPMDFAIRFEFGDDGSEACTVTTTVTMTPHGPMVLLTPLLKLAGPRRSARIAGRMREVVEATSETRGQAAQ
jgi:hypothetical protein